MAVPELAVKMSVAFFLLFHLPQCQYCLIYMLRFAATISVHTYVLFMIVAAVAISVLFMLRPKQKVLC